MYTLFNEPRVVTTAAQSSARFNYVKAAVSNNLERVVSYYRRNAKAVASDHLLVQLLQHIPLDLDLDLRLYKNRVEDLSEDLTRVFRLTSSINVGESRYPGAFYGEDTEEVILITTEDFDLDKLSSQWENLSPVRFLSHPKTDLGMMPPFGKGYSEERGTAVIAVNLPMLACQYRQWVLRELSKDVEGDFSVKRTAMQFVASYPIPNSLESQLDLAYFNRLRAKLYRHDIPSINVSHPFFLNEKETEVDEGLEELIDKALRKRLNFHEVLEVLTPIKATSLREVVALPRIPMTRQVIWALTIARLPVTAFLLHWEEIGGSRRSYQEINIIKRSLRRLENDKNLDQMSSAGLAEKTRNLIEADIKPFL